VWTTPSPASKLPARSGSSTRSTRRTRAATRSPRAAGSAPQRRGPADARQGVLPESAQGRGGETVGWARPGFEIRATFERDPRPGGPPPGPRGAEEPATKRNLPATPAQPPVRIQTGCPSRTTEAL
jgi:hypothetical protein